MSYTEWNVSKRYLICFSIETSYTEEKASKSERLKKSRNPNKLFFHYIDSNIEPTLCLKLFAEFLNTLGLPYSTFLWHHFDNTLALNRLHDRRLQRRHWTHLGRLSRLHCTLPHPHGLRVTFSWYKQTKNWNQTGSNLSLSSRLTMLSKRLGRRLCMYRYFFKEFVRSLKSFVETSVQIHICGAHVSIFFRRG